MYFAQNLDKKLGTTLFFAIKMKSNAISTGEIEFQQFGENIL